MGTITDKLNKLAETKSAIKTAIVNKGVAVSDSDTFASYANKIASISGGGTPTEGIYGVFIYDTNGNLTKPEEWDTANNDLAVGVAVIDGNCSFVIGKTQNDSRIAWSSQLAGTSVSGILTTTDDYEIRIDCIGEANSAIVRGLTSGETNAFNWAYDNTITVNGTILHGYIGAAGEWQTAYDNKAAVDNALSTIGGAAMANDWYWSSTQNSSGRAWLLTWSNGAVGSHDKGSGNYARAFYHLDYPNNKIATKLNDGNVIVTGSNYTIPSGSFNHIIIDGNRAYPNIDSFEYNSDSTDNLLYIFFPIRYYSNSSCSFIYSRNITINAPKCNSISYLFGYSDDSYVKNLAGQLNLNINISGSTTSIQSLLYRFKGEVNLVINDTSNINNFNSLFWYNDAITKINELDTSAGIDFYYIFMGCESLIKIAGLSLKSFSSNISYYYFTGYNYMSKLRYALLKDLGTGSECTSADFSYWNVWGIEDETVPLSAGARQSLIDTLITYSYDRATAGYSTCTVTLSANTKALLTEDEIAQMTAKGYTLA